MKQEKEILKKHFGDYYPKLEKWEFFNHILNAMNEIANIGSTEDMLKQCCQKDLFDETVPEDQVNTEVWKEVIEYLNIKAGKKFQFTDSNKRIIESRLKEGFGKADCYTVIANKCQDWKGSTQEKYLRPATLFQASKFEGYLNEKSIKDLTGDDNFNYNPTEEPELS